MKTQKLSTIPPTIKEERFFMDKTWVDFETVKAAVSVRQVIEHYGIKGLKERRDELRGGCPIHQGEGDRSFHINLVKKAFFCFSCQAKGNLIDFVAAMEKCSFRDAALRLQQWFGLSGGDGKAASATPTPENTTGSKLAREERAGECSSVANPPLRFQLQGIDHTHAYLVGRGISTQTAETFGVGFFPGKGSMSGRVVIPIHNGAGELVAYAGRSIDNTEPRYKLPAGFHKSAELYNLHRAIATGERGLIVVEGFFDCMKVSQAGYPFVVALMGCSLSTEQEELLVENAGMVLLMLDGDESGQKATEEILLRIGRKVWTKAVTLPAEKQPDQMSGEEIQGFLKK
jgi:DNA primase